MIFQFKQFAINQTGCTMKVNTDGVLLGALADANKNNAKQILDIGTGTGVVALMLAQRFSLALVDAVEIDPQTAYIAIENFKQSPFASQLAGYSLSFETFFNQNTEKKYDLIVSNPPFFIDTLKSDSLFKQLARHTDISFFERLIQNVSVHLENKGLLWLILPIEVVRRIQSICLKYDLFLQTKISIRSFKHSTPHREVIAIGFQQPEKEMESKTFVIYDHPKQYSEQYEELLVDFLTIF